MRASDSWKIEGIGVSDDAVYPFLDEEKCYSLVAELFPKEFKAGEWDQEPAEYFDLDEFLSENSGLEIHNICDLLARADESGVMSVGDDGQSATYFYYKRTFPWERRPNEPQSAEEVYQIILTALFKICDITEEQARNIINNNMDITGYYS